MSSGKLPLRIELSPSRQLSIVLALTHGLALSTVWITVLPVAVKCLLSLAIGLSAGYYYLRFVYPGRWFISQLMLLPDMSWTLQKATGRQIHAHLQSYYLHPAVLILWFGWGQWKRCAVLLLPDNADVDTVRRLRSVLLGAEVKD